MFLAHRLSVKKSTMVSMSFNSNIANQSMFLPSSLKRRLRDRDEVNKRRLTSKKVVSR